MECSGLQIYLLAITLLDLTRAVARGWNFGSWPGPAAVDQTVLPGSDGAFLVAASVDAGLAAIFAPVVTEVYAVVGARG